MPSLQAGPYTVTAQAPGFSQARSQVVVAVDKTVTADLQLALGNLSQKVEVTEAVSPVEVEKDTHEIATVISTKDFQNSAVKRQKLPEHRFCWYRSSIGARCFCICRRSGDEFRLREPRNHSGRSVCRKYDLSSGWRDQRQPSDSDGQYCSLYGIDSGDERRVDRDVCPLRDARSSQRDHQTRQQQLPRYRLRLPRE